MDFVGAISREIFDISWYWWIVLVVVMVITYTTRKNQNNRKNRIIETILTGYVLLIIIVTLLNRSFTEMEPQLRLFWSYGKLEYVSEVLLNYVLFFPLGTLLELKEWIVWKV